MMVQTDRFTVEVDVDDNTIHVRLRPGTLVTEGLITWVNNNTDPVRGLIGRPNVAHLVLRIEKEKVDDDK